MMILNWLHICYSFILLYVLLLSGTASSGVRESQNAEIPPDEHMDSSIEPMDSYGVLKCALHKTLIIFVDIIIEIFCSRCCESKWQW